MNQKVQIITGDVIHDYIEMAALITGADEDTAKMVVLAFEMLSSQIPGSEAKYALETLKENIKKNDTQEEC